MKRAIGMGLLALGMLVGRADAQQPGRGWEQLSPGEQRRAWENYQRYRALPQQRQQFIEKRFRRFRGMPRQERQRLQQNYETYQRQNPKQRKEFNRKYRRWKSERR